MTSPRKPRVRRSWFTVVGVYSDNWQKFCDHVLAVDARQAEEQIRNKPETDEDLVIVAVFKGKLMAVDEEPTAQVPGLPFIQRL